MSGGVTVPKETISLGLDALPDTLKKDIEKHGSLILEKRRVAAEMKQTNL